MGVELQENSRLDSSILSSLSSISCANNINCHLPHNSSEATSAAAAASGWLGKCYWASLTPAVLLSPWHPHFQSPKAAPAINHQPIVGTQ
jgi:hypothetical protein